MLCHLCFGFHDDGYLGSMKLNKIELFGQLWNSIDVVLTALVERNMILLKNQWLSETIRLPRLRTRASPPTGGVSVTTPDVAICMSTEQFYHSDFYAKDDYLTV